MSEIHILVISRARGMYEGTKRPRSWAMHACKSDTSLAPMVSISFGGRLHTYVVASRGCSLRVSRSSVVSRVSSRRSSRYHARTSRYILFL